MRLTHIFLTHLHADHILGIPGLLETMAFQGREEPLTIAGPINTARMLDCFKSVCYFSRHFPVRAVYGPREAVRPAARRWSTAATGPRRSAVLFPLPHRATGAVF